MSTKGAIRAAAKIADSHPYTFGNADIKEAAQIIDEETGLAELYKGAKQHVADIERCTEVYWVDDDLQAGVNKVEGKQ